MALITFARVAAPAGSWSPTHNPNYGSGYVRTIRRHQPISLSDGGDVYAYHKGDSERVTLLWPQMPVAEMATLLSFFGTMCGGRYTFTYTDPDGGTHTARLMNPDSLNHRDVGGGRYEVSLELEMA